PERADRRCSRIIPARRARSNATGGSLASWSRCRRSMENVRTMQALDLFRPDQWHDFFITVGGGPAPASQREIFGPVRTGRDACQRGPLKDSSSCCSSLSMSQDTWAFDELVLVVRGRDHTALGGIASPPTTTGLPRRSGRRTNSTAAM